MQGSLSDPPIVYTQPRIWMVLIFVITAFLDYKLVPLAGKLLFAVIKNPPSSVGLLLTMALALVMFFGATAMIIALTVFSILRVISPATLSLSPDGIRMQKGSSVRQYDWRLVTNVRVDSGGRGSRWVVFDYPEADRPPGWFSRLNTKLGGASVGLGGYWDASCSEIADTITEACNRWYKDKG